MKFIVYGTKWASGAPDPKDVLKRYVKAEPILLTAFDYTVDITPEELMRMAEDQQFDVLISANGLIAFDSPGRGFTQR